VGRNTIRASVRGGLGQRALARTGEAAGRVEIVGFDDELLGQAALLRSSEWGGTSRANSDYLVWKYLRNPYLDPPVLQFALRAGRVVGMRGSIGACWESAGVRYMIPSGGDLVVDRGQRGRGIAGAMQRAALAELADRGIGASISLSANRLGAASAASGGWVPVAGLEVVEWERTAPSYTHRLASVGIDETFRLVRRMRVPVSRRRVSPFRELDVAIARRRHRLRRAAPAELAAIAALEGSSPRLRHVRDEEYFSWRLSNPLAHYRALASSDAYVVLHWDGERTFANLVDWRSRDRSALDALGGEILEHVQGLRMWSTSLDDALWDVVGAVGQLTESTDPSAAFVVRTTDVDRCDLEHAGATLTDAACWDIRMLDSDAF
jgi:GNAT superfamily N-acetyltransferase